MSAPKRPNLVNVPGSSIESNLSSRSRVSSRFFSGINNLCLVEDACTVSLWRVG